MEATTNRPSIPACPISLDPLKDPVILDCSCHGTVSRKSFATWKLHQVKGRTTGRAPCPNCGRPLQSLKVVPNVPLCELLESLGLGDEEDENDSGVMYDEENIHSKHHDVSNGGELTNPLEEESNEPPSAGYFGCNLWIRIGIAVLSLVATIGVITGVMKATKSSAAAAPVSPPSRCDAKQLGPDLDGEADRDVFGGSVSLSSDGNRLAVGATQHRNGNEDKAGHVRVFDWSGSSWIQVGSDLDGEAGGDGFGGSVSLSSNGNRLAVGATDNDGNGNYAGHVRVFEWSESTWIQVGSDLDGEAAGDQFGVSVSLSSDGTRLAVGAYNNAGNGSNAGHVRVFDWSEDSWIQLGANLNGERAGDEFGGSVSLSSDGNRLAVGAIEYNFGNEDRAGRVRVFEWSESNWIQLGSDLDGDAGGDRFGGSVSLSSDGYRLAVGARWSDGNGDKAGRARVFEWSGSTWIQLGSDLDGEAAFDQFGGSVSLSSDGNRLAVGAEVNNGNGCDAGHVRVFDWTGSTWIQLGSDLDGESAFDLFGGSVSLSSDGNRLSVGAFLNDGNGTNAGHVRVFELIDASCEA